MYLGGVLVMVGVLKLLVETRRPLLCAGVYAGATSLVALMSGQAAATLLLGAPLALVASGTFFWAIDRFVLD